MEIQQLSLFDETLLSSLSDEARGDGGKAHQPLSTSEKSEGDLNHRVRSILEPESSSKEYRKNWARLIQKKYEVDPLTCPKCQGQMRIIAFIEDEEVIEKILKHLGLWEVKARPPPEYLRGREDRDW